MAKRHRVPKRRTAPTVPIFYPDWLLLSELSADIEAALERFATGRLLDVGCGECPYARCNSAVTQWIGFDADSNSSADITGSIYQLPVESASFDTVLCTQVLEHLERPVDALRELHRVLRAPGKLILSVPQYWPLHEEPHDFFRYTTLGLNSVVSACGFRLVEMKSQGRGARVAGQALNNAMLCAGDTYAFREQLWFKAMKAPFYLLVNITSALLGTVLKTPRDVLNHLIVAEKAEPAEPL